MKAYRCHKVVRAMKVESERYDSPRNQTALTDQSGETIYIAADDFHRLARMGQGSTIGGYLVQYEDGYVSWSPAKAFETGYTEVQP